MLIPRHINKAMISVIVTMLLSVTQFSQAASPMENMMGPQGGGAGGFQTSPSGKPNSSGAKDIKEIIANVNYKLEAVLSVANDGSAVAEQDILLLDETLREASSFRAKFEKKELCNFYMLSAWTRYFAGDFKRALKDAMSATKTDPEDKDAQATFIAMSMLNKDYKRMSMSWEQITETSLFTKGNDSRSSSRSSSSRSSSRSSDGWARYSPACSPRRSIAKRSSSTAARPPRCANRWWIGSSAEMDRRRSSCSH